MKKMLIALLLIVCMLPACAWAETITITYLSNNGMNQTALQYVEAGEWFKTYAADFFKAPEGKEFYCWLVQTPGRIDQVDAGFEVKTDEALTITADWVDKKPQMVTININPGDGAMAAGESNKKTSPKGKDAILPPWDVVKAPEGKFFFCWDVNGVLYEGGGTYKNLQEDLTIEAVYLAEGAQTIVVNFRANGGTGTMNAPCILLNDNYTLPECEYTAPEGMRFKCWEISGKEYAPGDSITVDGKKTIKAVWEELPDCEITFNGNGATDGTMDSATVKEGDSYMLPWCNFTRTGHEFKGWLVGGVLKQAYDSITVSADTEIVASWEAYVYNVIFSAGIGEDGNNSAGVTLEKTYGVGFKLEDASAFGFTCKGHNFVGWKDETNGPNENAKLYAVGDEFVPEAFTILVAQWEPKQYKVTFKPGTGTGEMADGVATYGYPYNLPDCAFKAPVGYVFKAWLMNGKEVPVGTSLLAESDTEVTAVWEAEIYKLTYKTGDGMGAVRPVEATYGQTVTLAEPPDVDEKWIFTGWLIGEKKYHPGDSIEMTGNVTATAQWRIRDVGITYENDAGETLFVDDTLTYGKEHRMLTLDELNAKLADDKKLVVPADSVFKGWNVFNTDGEVIFTMNERDFLPVYSIWTVRANWSAKDPVFYTVSYEAGGASGSVPASAKVEAGKQHTVAKPDGLNAGKGKQFDGWLVKGTQTKYGPEKPITVNGNMTLVAQWKDRKVSLSYQDASGKEVHKVEMTYGQSHTVLTPLEAGLLVEPGYQFVGWQLYNNKGGKIEDVTATAGQPLTLHSEWWIRPIWEKIYYTVSYEAGGASGSVPASAKVEAGAQYKVAEPLTVENGESMVFNGWLVKGTQTKYGPGQSIPVNSNMTLVAQWKLRTVSLTYQDEKGSTLMEPIQMDYGKTHTVLAPSGVGLFIPKGYEFVGWNVHNNRGGKLDDVTAVVGQPMTVYSHWLLRPVLVKIQYKVSFDANGASGTMDAVTVGENDSYKVPANAFTAPKGHHFGGWTLDGAPVTVGDFITVSKPITLKANWEKNIYTVKTMDSNAASSAVSEQKEYGTKITLPACPYTATSEYHSFAYWKVEDAQGVSKLKPGASVTVESDMVISAIWDFDDSVKTRVEQVADITSLPPQEKKELEQKMLQEMPPQLQTIEAVVEELAEQTQDEGFVAEQTEVHEVKLMFKPANSDEWIEATEENFPTAGIEVRMPLPEGTNAADYEFLVVHMFTTKSERLGTEPGKTETIVPVIENGELVFTLNGLSPVSVAWKERPMEGKLEAAQLPKTGDASCLTAWIALLGASGAGFAVIRRRKK